MELIKELKEDEIMVSSLDFIFLRLLIAKSNNPNSNFENPLEFLELLKLEFEEIYREAEEKLYMGE
jgi:hypothetical protein